MPYQRDDDILAGVLYRPMVFAVGLTSRRNPSRLVLLLITARFDFDYQTLIDDLLDIEIQASTKMRREISA